MTTQQIISQGTPIRRSLKDNDTFSYEGKKYPKFDLYDIEGEEYAVPTDLYKEHLALKESKVEEIDSGRTFDDYLGKDTNGNIPKLKRFVEEFETKYFKHSLYIWSRFNSTQKTTSAKIILREISKKYKLPVSFVIANSLMSDLKNYDFSEEARKNIDLYRKAAFLVIDDAFSSDKVTKYSSGYQVSFLDTFLRERLEALGKATCFTSNIPTSEISEQWGPSIGALIERNVFSMEFNDVLGKEIDFDINHIFD